MKCPRCGEENPGDAQKCRHCGAVLNQHLGADETISFAAPQVEDAGGRLNLDTLVGAEPVLVVTKGRTLGETFVLNKSEIKIGRDPQNDIFLNDITVSRHHARLKIHKDGAEIEDIGSLNGTYVNNRQIEKASLSNRDELQIGKFKLVFLFKREEGAKNKVSGEE